MTEYRTSSEALPHLLARILDYGKLRSSRNGRMKELVHVQETITDPTRPYITTPGRHASLPAQIAEMMWLLSGRDDIEWLSHYLPRAPEFSDDGKTWRGAYGPRIRGSHGGLDQLRYVVGLLNADPDSRRAVISIYDPEKDSRPGKDIPCNNWLHFLIRDGVLYTHVATRSNDVMWGWSGINAFEWSVLAQIVAALTSTSPGPVTFSVSSLHLYDRHFDKAERIVEGVLGVENDLDGPVYGVDLDKAPGVGDLLSVSVLDQHVEQWFRAEQIIRSSLGGPPRSAVEAVENPLFRSWAEVMYAYWTGDHSHLDSLYAGTDLLAAYHQSPKRRKASPGSQLVKEVSELHREKGKVYGTSWRKRGETYSILPNIARKVDRLGVGGAGDSELDTYVDLVVYLVKYHTWMTVGEEESDDPDVIEAAIERLSASAPRSDVDNIQETVREIQSDYDEVLLSSRYCQEDRVTAVHVMAEEAWRIARQLHREGARL